MGVNTQREKTEKKKLADNQGQTYQVALEKMKEDDVHASKEVDDYIVSLACEDAEGMYMYDDLGKLSWMIPHQGENQHVEIVVQDKDDLRFLPGLEVSCKLIDEEDTVVADLKIPFIWHPFLFHYGINCIIPKAGKYRAEVFIKKPEFHRHDEEVGKRFEHDVTVTLGPVTLTPGRKEHGAE
ncbi:hypothetical protein BH11PAT1_BH11PAT1_5710 [soil metagenome]